VAAACRDAPEPEADPEAAKVAAACPAGSVTADSGSTEPSPEAAKVTDTPGTGDTAWWRVSEAPVSGWVQTSQWTRETVARTGADAPGARGDEDVPVPSGKVRVISR
jgi:hypothetical protein